MPLDCRPRPDGNLFALQQAGDFGVECCDEPMIAVSVTATDHPAVANAINCDLPRYVSHFGTCPQAARHRTKQTKQ
jgi:hypothetical protein